MSSSPPPPPPPTPPPPGEPAAGPPGPGRREVPPALAALGERKRAEVRRAKDRMTFAELEAMVAMAEEPRNFFAAVTKRPAPPRRAGDVALIAEIGRFDNAGTPLRPEFADAGTGDRASAGEGGYDVAGIARRYEAAGAAAIAVATDAQAGGKLGDLEVARESTTLPVLRRDVIVDPWQLWESRAAGADAVLLIADLLTEGELVDLLILSQQLRLTAIIEVRSMEGLLRVRPHVGFPHRAYGLLGINNREMSAAPEGDVAGTLRLLDMVEDLTVLVSEGGVRSRADVERLSRRGVRIVLVGAEILKRDDPAAAIGELRGPFVR